MRIGYYVGTELHYAPHVLPLIEETGGLLITLNKRTFQYIKNSKKNFEILYYKSLEDFRKSFHDLSIDILVHAGFSYKFFKRFPELKHVQVFHDIADKPYRFKKSLRFYDLIIVPGPKGKEDIVKKMLADHEKIVITGYPKIDTFLHSNFDCTDFKKELGLNISKKTVLYAPTWFRWNFSSFSKYIVSILRNLKDFNVIVKPHLNILRYRPWEIFKAYIMKRKNCFIYPRSVNILPFMAVSDIMLTDISTVSKEYLTFDKPLIFLSPRPKETIPEAYRWIWYCGDVIENKKDILHVVEENLDNPIKYKKERDIALKQTFLDFDGKSAQRFKMALEILMNIS